ncbi:MAG: ABC transporter ATP-binding protein [Oscillospiraceae bacterium]|nr:ABC transporter ATP-binding protein [Oscillospiraceae bacterium]
MEFRTNVLAVGYRKHVVAEGVTFSVQPGEILTLIGPNGAGKSTVLRTIAAQLPPLGGEVLLDAKSVHRMAEKDIARRISLFLTQQIRPELMTCADIVATGRYPYTGRLGILSAHDREKVAEAMALTHVTELAGMDFTCISDGQRQRVMLARAICQEPELLILDEPTSYLDVRHKLELLTLIKQLVRETGLTVIMSLHELELAERVSDRILCIRDGKIDRMGTPDQIFTGDYIRTLYDIESGSFDPLYGVPELKRMDGTPEVFVIGGGGTGIPVYRRLQREGVPFAAGVLQENDIDYPVAAALAVRVVTVPAFEPVSDAAVQEALGVTAQCRDVICCLERFGSMNEGNRYLAEQAGVICSGHAETGYSEI